MDDAIEVEVQIVHLLAIGVWLGSVHWVGHSINFERGLLDYWRYDLLQLVDGFQMRQRRHALGYFLVNHRKSAGTPMLSIWWWLLSSRVGV